MPTLVIVFLVDFAATIQKRGIRMKTVSILLPDIAAIKLFVSIVEQYEFDVDLICGRYRVNAKSMMGILSLGSGIPVSIEIHADDEEAAELLGKLDVYVVNN
jgi:phosphotransferase system HPr-like phosphotransfer protein